MCRRIFFSCLALVILGVAGLGILFWDITRPEPEPAGSTGSTAPVPGERSAPRGGTGGAGTPAEEPRARRRRAEAIAKRVADQYEGGNGRSRQSPDRRFEVRLTEEEATEMIRSLPDVRESLEREHIEAARIRFQDDRLIASARVPVYGSVQARVSLTGRVGPRDGRLDYSTESVRIGSIPAPGEVREALDKQIRAGIEKFNGDFKGRVQEVTARGGTLTVVGEREK